MKNLQILAVHTTPTQTIEQESSIVKLQGHSTPPQRARSRIRAPQTLDQHPALIYNGFSLEANALSQLFLS